MPKGPWKRPADDADAMTFALRHPLRRKLLVAFDEGEYSPTQVSLRYGEELHRVAYHTRALDFYGLVELVELRPVRGSTEHFYKATELGRRALQVAEQTGMIEPRKGGGG